MFNKKKVCVALSAVLALSMIVMPVDSQAAKKIKLSKTKLTMKVGNKKTVSVKNAKKSAKVTWKSNKKKIATVKKSGKLSAKITAKKVGNAVITCKVKGNKSKLTVKVKVTAKSSNSQVTKAPESTTTPAQTSDATPSATATPNAEPTPFVPVPYSGKGFDEKGLATFEDGDTAGFAGRGNASVTVADEGYEGKCLYVSKRSATWHGCSMPFSDKLVGGATYHISAYVKQVSGKATQIKATQELDGSWNQIGAVDNAASGEWVFVEGDMKVPHGYSSISLIFEMPNDSNSDFYVDNVSVVQVTEAAEEEKLPSLKEVYKDIFPHFGTCAAYSAGWASVKQASTLKFITSQYNSITLENEMKPQYLMNRNTMSVEEAKAQGYLVPDDYKESTVMTINMSNVDEILQYVYDNGLQVRGHTLLWHSQTPTWFFKENYSDSGAVVKPEVMDKRIELYVGTVMNHVLKKEKEITGKAGSIVYAWDVTNEYINRNNDPTNPSWVDVYGDLGLKPTYVKKAYEEAYKQLKAFGVEKDVTLFYNDYNTYFNGNDDNIIKMLDYVNEGEEAMICSGVGMQSHIDVGNPKPKKFGLTVQKFLDHGFEVQITELDITINYNGYSSGKTAEDQAVYAKSLFETLIDIQKNVDKTKSKGITGITVWGLYDSVSWRRENDPLFFTSATTPKPSFYAIIEAATE